MISLGWNGNWAFWFHNNLFGVTASLFLSEASKNIPVINLVAFPVSILPIDGSHKIIILKLPEVGYDDGENGWTPNSELIDNNWARSALTFELSFEFLSPNK